MHKVIRNNAHPALILYPRNFTKDEFDSGYSIWRRQTNNNDLALRLNTFSVSGDYSYMRAVELDAAKSGNERFNNLTVRVYLYKKRKQLALNEAA